jgi:hypothetical protein
VSAPVKFLAGFVLFVTFAAGGLGAIAGMYELFQQTGMRQIPAVAASLCVFGVIGGVLAISFIDD